MGKGEEGDSRGQQEYLKWRGDLSLCDTLSHARSA